MIIPVSNEPISIQEMLHPSDYSKASDYRGVYLGDRCLCGSELFHLIGSFENGELTFYFLDGECLNCGSLVTLPYPREGGDDA